MKKKRKLILHMIKRALDECELSIKDKFLIIDSLNRYFNFKKQQINFQKAINKKGDRSNDI